MDVVSILRLWLFLHLVGWYSAVTAAEEDDDLCNENSSSLYCTCSPSDILAQSVNCFVMNVLEIDDRRWNGFRSQTELQRLTIMSRPNGMLRQIPPVALKSSDKIQQILIRYGNITSISPEAFQDAPNLVTIDLTDNGIAALGGRSFSGLPVLESLVLTDNLIEVIPKDSFYDLPKLKTLLLDQNNIKKVEPGAFSHSLLSLMELELANNAIRSLEPGALKGLTNLTRLDMRYNLLEKIEPTTFGTLPALRELVLTDNNVDFIHPNAFQGLTNLTSLDLTGNKLSYLPNTVFVKTLSLMQLSLRRNNFHTLSQRVFWPLSLRSKEIEGTSGEPIAADQASNIYSRIQLEENPFVCDCTLKWMHNEASLRQNGQSDDWNRITCTNGTSNPIRLVDLSVEELVCVDKNIKNNNEEISLNILKVEKIVTDESTEKIIVITNGSKDKINFNFMLNAALVLLVLQVLS